MLYMSHMLVTRPFISQGRDLCTKYEILICYNSCYGSPENCQIFEGFYYLPEVILKRRHQIHLKVCITRLRPPDPERDGGELVPPDGELGPSELKCPDIGEDAVH